VFLHKAGWENYWLTRERLRYYLRAGKIDTAVPWAEGRLEMKASARKVSEMTVDELRAVISDVIAEDIESWRETFDILSDKRLTQQLKRADQDWASRKKGAYVSWEDLKNV
jgi:uncharacterized protein YbjT (DUF2867 family)